MYYQLNKLAKPGELTYIPLQNNEKLMNNKKLRYVHFRELYKLLTYDFFNASKKQFNETERNYMYSEVYEGMKEASDNGFYEANYFIAMLYMNGFYKKKSFKKAYFHLCKAAAAGHAMSYYELYKM